MKIELIFAFILATLANVFCSAIFPEVHLLYFAPLLALSRSFSLNVVLWQAALCGAIADLLSSSPFGLNSVSYTLTALFLFRTHKFFNDNPFNLSLFTIAISQTFYLIYISLSFILGYYIKLTTFSFLTDFMIMPILDAIYAFIWFFCPLKGVNVIRKFISRHYMTRFSGKNYD